MYQAQGLWLEDKVSFNSNDWEVDRNLYPFLDKDYPHVKKMRYISTHLKNQSFEIFMLNYLSKWIIKGKIWEISYEYVGQKL